MSLRTGMVFLLLWAGQAAVFAQSPATMTGLEIMQEIQRRHYLNMSIYEELSIILTDSMGNRDTRSLRRYSKTDDRGNMKYLLLLDTPADVHGAALLASRDAVGRSDIMVYLPAFGGTIRYVQHRGEDNTIMGMDFSLEDLTWSSLADYQFVRRDVERIGNTDYFVVDTYASDTDITQAIPLRRHYVRQDGFYILRTEYFDKQGRLIKRLTLHDVSRHGTGVWRAGMFLMENFRENHSTLLRVNRQAISADYVPDEVFTVEWLHQNQPPLEPDDSLDGGYEQNLDTSAQFVFHSVPLAEFLQGCLQAC